MRSCPELLLISELLEALDSGDAPWDQLAQEQSQLHAQPEAVACREWEQGKPHPCASCWGCMAVPGILFWAGNCLASGSPARLPAAITSPGWQMLPGTFSLGCCKDRGGKQLFLPKESVGQGCPTHLPWRKAFFHLPGPAQSKELCPLC